jgi:hypothetical protein
VLAYLILGARLLLAGVLALALAGKLRDLPAFRASLAQFGVRARRTAVVAPAVVAAEALTVGLLLVPGGALAGLVLAAGLLGLFAVVLSRVACPDAPVRCRCFGGTSERVGPAHVWRNVALASVATGGAAAVAAGKGGGLSDPAVVLLTVAVAVVLAGLVAGLDDLLALGRV